MSESASAPREWPPVDLIAGLSLKTIAEPELQLDENVISGKNPQCREGRPRSIFQPFSMT